MHDDFGPGLDWLNERIRRNDNEVNEASKDLEKLNDEVSYLTEKIKKIDSETKSLKAIRDLVVREQ